MDGDDAFVSRHCLYMIMMAIEQASPQTDILMEPQVHTTYGELNMSLRDPCSNPYVWDKVWRLDFVRRNDIRFASDIFYYDDVIFTQCAFLNKPIT